MQLFAIQSFKKYLLNLSICAIAIFNNSSILAFEKSKEPIIYCLDTNWMPYEGLTDGKHDGISADYFRLITKHSGLNFKLLETSSWADSLEKLKSGACHATPFLNFTRDRSEFLAFTEIYFESPNVIVATGDQPFLQSLSNIGDKTLAITRAYRLAEYIKQNYPEIKTIEVETELDGLIDVAEGKVDFFVGSILTINNRIFDRKLENLKVAGWVGQSDKLRFGVIHSKAYLIPKINEALEKITEAEHIDILSRWTNTQFVERTDYALAWKITLVAVLILIFMFWRQRVVRKFNQVLQKKNVELERLKIKLETTNQKLKFLSSHDPLTNLYNRNYINSNIFSDLRADESTSVCLIVADIDFFKEVNDTYGHAVGDEILKEFSAILSKTVRDKDIVARWGGEEFVILCHQSRRSDAISLCSRIMARVKEYRFTQIENITVSFGIAKLKEDESIMQCFDRADKALYKAKEQGRDQVCCA